MADRQLSWSMAIPWLLTIVTLIGGIWQFYEQQSQANRQPFLQKQLELAFEATDAAGTLASATDAVAWEKARTTFWRLYWGSLSIVEDPEVERAMVEMGRLVPTTSQPPPELPMTALQTPSYRLAHAMRRLVLQSWNVELPALAGER